MPRIALALSDGDLEREIVRLYKKGLENSADYRNLYAEFKLRIKEQADKIEVNETNVIDFIMDLEGDGLSQAGTVALFRYLEKSGTIRGLQGSYGRSLAAMKRDGWL